MTRSRAAPAPGTTTMAAGAGGSSPEEQQQHGDHQAIEDHQDEPQQETVMPGFRFHPTEEELIEFYLRRKVDGKRFNIDLISFLDLYRYDPWDLPGLASIGDKEWFFYVPRDRKYRNGDRPNRVTPSGYWKATGADRMVRVVAGEAAGVSRSIGLKKTLVFYVGKAPKGLRSSWIMNEYRLPHADAQRYQKEISLCRVYKRPGIEDNFHLTGTTTRSSASSKATGTKHHTGAAHRTTATTNRQQHAPMFVSGHHPSPSSLKPYNHQAAAAAAAAGVQMAAPPAMFLRSTASVASLSSTTSTEEDGTSLYHLKGPNNSNPAAMQPSSMHASSLLNMSSSAAAMAAIPIDELSRAIGSYSTQAAANPNNNQQQPTPPSQISPLLNFPSLEKIWDWNPLLESPKVCTSFK